MFRGSSNSQGKGYMPVMLVEPTSSQVERRRRRSSALSTASSVSELHAAVEVATSRGRGCCSRIRRHFRKVLRCCRPSSLCSCCSRNRARPSLSEGKPKNLSPGSPKERSISLFFLLLSVAALLLFLVLYWEESKLAFLEGMEWLQGLPVLQGALVLSFANIVGALLFLPCLPFTLGAGFLYGTVTGSLIICVATTIAAVVAFVVSRHVARGLIEQSFLQGSSASSSTASKFRIIDQAIRADGLRIVFLIRTSPLHPYGVFNYLCGLTSITLKDYTVASFFAMIPGTVMEVYFGTAIKNVSDIVNGELEQSSTQIAFFYIGLGVTLLVTVIITAYIKIRLGAELQKYQEEDAETESATRPQLSTPNLGSLQESHPTPPQGKPGKNPFHETAPFTAPHDSLGSRTRARDLNSSTPVMVGAGSHLHPQDTPTADGTQKMTSLDEHRYGLESALSWDAVGASLLLEADRLQIPSALRFGFSDSEEEALGRGEDREFGLGDWGDPVGRCVFPEQQEGVAEDLDDGMEDLDPEGEVIPQLHLESLNSSTIHIPPIE